MYILIYKNNFYYYKITQSQIFKIWLLIIITYIIIIIIINIVINFNNYGETKKMKKSKGINNYFWKMKMLLI